MQPHIKFEARFVALGYRQILGIDYWETFAPVSDTESIRMIFAISASKNMIIDQMDIDTAFLNAVLEEIIHMPAPDGITVGLDECLLLKKSLKQSPRNFNMNVDGQLKTMGFKNTISDVCVYTNNINGFDIIISVFICR